MANVTVIGAQWGDEGKGKLVDWLSNRADVVVRFQGGHNAGHTLVVGNQVYKLSLLPSGVVQGKLSVIGNGVVVDPWHLLEEIARIEACYAPGRDESPPDPRRKPEPGMLLDAARDLGLDLSRSWMIGDRWRDIDCGHRAGVRTVFIDFGYEEDLQTQPDFTVKNFPEAARIILAQPEARKLNP